MTLMLTYMRASSLDSTRGGLIELNFCSEVCIFFVDDTTRLTDKPTLIRY